MTHIDTGRIGIIGITYTSLDAFIKAIQSRGCQPGSFVSLPSKANIKQIKSLTATLASGNCPSRLTICVQNSTYTILKHFKRTLLSGKAPEELCLSFNFPENISIIELRALNGLIVTNKRPPRLTLQFISPMKLPKLTNYLFKALKKTRCFAPLSLDLAYLLDRNDFNRIQKTLSSGKCPKDFSLTISKHLLNEEEIRLMATALKSGKCQIDFKLSLPNQQLNDADAQQFAEALGTGNCPQGFNFDPGHLVITEEGIKSVSYALVTGKCPSKLTLTFEKSLNTTKLPEYLARALISKKCPPGLTLTFRRSPFDTPDDNSQRALYLAQALLSGNCPKYLTMNFRDQLIEDNGVEYLAEALKSGKCPLGLTLNLNKNSLTDKTIELLSDAIAYGNCPLQLTINLVENDFTYKAKQKFFDKVNLQTPPPIGLTIYFSGSQNPEATDYLTKLWQSLLLAYIGFLQGQNTGNNLVTRLPSAILEHIFSFVMATRQPACPFKFAHQKIENVYEKRNQKMSKNNSPTKGSRFFFKSDEKNAMKEPLKMSLNPP